MRKNPTYKPEVCPTCQQTKTYALPLSRGTALMVLALYNAVRLKGVNKIHIGNDMVADAKAFRSYREMISAGKMTYKMEGNMTTLHRHGLAAQSEDQGVWLLTPKGSNFLFRGIDIPRVAIIDKLTGHKAYYLNEETDRVTFGKLMQKETAWWDIQSSSQALFEHNNPQLF